MPPAALAVDPTELFLSEYIEGSSNNKALEIYNGTGAAVDLLAGGYNIQMAFNGSAVPTLTINLSGAVASAALIETSSIGHQVTLLSVALD